MSRISIIWLVFMASLAAAPAWAADIAAPRKGSVVIEVAPMQPVEEPAAEPVPDQAPVATTPAAAAPVDREDADEDAIDDTDDTAAEVRVVARVPESLMARGWSLRVDGESYELTGDKVPVDTRSHSTIELLDPVGRVTVVARGRVDEALLERLRPRRWFVYAGIGTAQGAPSVWSSVLQSGTAARFQSGVRFQPSRWSLGFDVAFDGGGNEPIDKVASLYSSVTLATLVGLEAVPFARRGLALARLHLQGLIGGLWANHEITIADEYVALTDATSGFGWAWGAEARYPLLANVWVYSRWLSTRETIRLDRFDFATKAPRSSLTLGGGYAF